MCDFDNRMTPEAATILSVDVDTATPEADHEATIVNAPSSNDVQSQEVLLDAHDGPLLGSYRLQQQLVRTGLHRVYRARHIETGVQVAVKTYLLGARDSSAPERLHREWRLMRELDHRHIVRALDFGVERDVLYLVLEYLHGSGLDNVVKEWGPLPWRRAVNLARQAAIGLAFAHAHGVIHRDVKPSNFIVLRDGLLKTIDFGIAFEPANLCSITIDRQERLLGTIDYLSPEQSRSAHAVDARADIYSLGCTLYYLLAGRPPFTGSTIAARLLKHRDAPPPVLTDVRPDVPTRISDLVRRMMAKSPDDRPPTMLDVCGLLHT